MNNVILPFLMSMWLGRTIDLRTYTMSGVNVFDDGVYDEMTHNTLNSTYNVLQEDSFPYTFFGIPPDIVLRIKSNFLGSNSGAMGLEGVLKDNAWKFNSAVLSVTTIYRTVDRTLKADATALPDWTDKISPSQTHYVRSLFYGGWSVVLFKFKCDIPNDVHEVRRILNKHLGNVGALNNETLVKWSAAVKDIKRDPGIRGTVRISTQVYSTTPFSHDISSPESLVKAIVGFPTSVGAVGQPLFMDLKPLNDLDSRYPVVQENIELVSELEKLDHMFDDVKITKVNVMRWVSETETAFEDDDEERISKMLKNLNECIRAFNKVGAEASLFTQMDHAILDRAFQGYMKGLDRGVSTYNQAFRRLKEEIDAECHDEFLHKIKGLLRVNDNDVHFMGRVKGGFEECKGLCLADDRCRSLGYAESITEMDLDSGLNYVKEKQCWIYFRSTSTATVHTPSEMSGDMGVYDRNCY